MSEQDFFAWYDYLIFGITLAVSLGIGIYFAVSGDRQRTTAEYLAGNRRLMMLPVALSMFMSKISAILVLGYTAEAYRHGLLVFIGIISYMIGDVIAALVFVPLFYPLKITSMFEYYEMRFHNRAVRLTGAVMLLVTQILYIGLALFSPAVALEAVTGVPLWVSIVLSSLVGTIYTTIGGMKAVVWTDTFQGLVFFGSLVAVLIAGTVWAGGVATVLEVAGEGGRLRLFEWNPDPFLRLNTYNVVLSSIVAGAAIGTQQNSVQRICSTKSLRQAKWTVLSTIPMHLLATAIPLMTGLVVYTYYTKLGCDPLRTGQVTSANQLFPFFIVNAVRLPCLPGLMLAVLFSGALSSVSSSINACAAVTWKDFLEKRFSHLSEQNKARITKTLAFGYGATGTAVAFIYTYFGGNAMQVSGSLLAAVGAPLFGMLVVGALFPWANWIGVLSGGVASFAFGFTVGMANGLVNPYTPTLNTTTESCWQYNLTVLPLPPPRNNEDIFPLIRVSYLLISMMGMALCVITGLLVSLATGKTDPKTVEPRLNAPIFDRMCCCLPSSWLKFLRCGVPLEDKADKGRQGSSEEFRDDLPDGALAMSPARETKLHQTGYDDVEDAVTLPPTKTTRLMTTDKLDSD